MSGDPASPRYRQSTHDDRHGVYWKSMKVQRGDREELCRIQGEYKREEVPFASTHDGFVRLHQCRSPNFVNSSRAHSLKLSPS